MCEILIVQFFLITKFKKEIFKKTTTTRDMKKTGNTSTELKSNSKRKNDKEINKKEKVNAVVSDEVGLKDVHVEVKNLKK